MLAAVAVALCVVATAAQSFFWLAHSWKLNPGPVNLTQAVNWWPQAASAALARLSKSSLSTANLEPDLETAGQAAPREDRKMKKVLMMVIMRFPVGFPGRAVKTLVAPALALVVVAFVVTAAAAEV